MPFVKQLRANVKKSFQIPLSPITVLIAPSGSIKTAAWNALEILYCQGASDVGLSPWVGTPKALLDELLPPGEDTLYVYADVEQFPEEADDPEKVLGWTDEVEIVRNSGTGGAKTPEPKIQHGAIMPVRPFLEGMRGKPESVRQFLIERMLPPMTVADLKPTFEAHVDSWEQAWSDFATLQTGKDEAKQEQPGVQTLLLVRSAAVKAQNKAKKEGGAQKQLVTQLTKQTPPAPTNEQWEAAEAALAAAKAAIAQAPSLPSSPAVKPGFTVTIAQVQEAYQKAMDAQEAHQAATAEVATLQQKMQSSQVSTALLDLQKSLLTVVDAHIAEEVSKCFVCDTPLTPSMTARQHSIKAHLEEALSANAEANQAAVALIHAQEVLATASAKAASTLKTWEHLRDTYLEEKAVIDQWEAQHAEAAPESAPEGVPAPSFDAAGALAAAAAKMQGYTETLKIHDQIKAAKDAAAKALDEQSRYTKLVDACDTVSLALLEDARAGFVDRVNLYTDKEQFDLRLIDAETGAAICKWGFLRGEHLVTALSGYEIGHCLTAMTAACIHDMQGADGPILVSLPRDAMVDPDALRALVKGMSTLRGFGAQVIIPSVHRPKGPRVKGVTYLHLDKSGGVIKVENDEDPAE